VKTASFVSIRRASGVRSQLLRVCVARGRNGASHNGHLAALIRDLLPPAAAAAYTGVLLLLPPPPLLEQRKLHSISQERRQEYYCYCRTVCVYCL
jgi:hypothetical protein